MLLPEYCDQMDCVWLATHHHLTGAGQTRGDFYHYRIHTTDSWENPTKNNNSKKCFRLLRIYRVSAVCGVSHRLSHSTFTTTLNSQRSHHPLGYACRSWGSEILSTLPKISQLVNGGIGIATKDAWPWSLHLLLLTPDAVLSYSLGELPRGGWARGTANQLALSMHTSRGRLNILAREQMRPVRPSI